MKRPSEKYKIASMFINSLQEEILCKRNDGYNYGENKSSVLC